jgi:hypothetical protein
MKKILWFPVDMKAMLRIQDDFLLNLGFNTGTIYRYYIPVPVISFADPGFHPGLFSVTILKLSIN